MKKEEEEKRVRLMQKHLELKHACTCNHVVQAERLLNDPESGEFVNMVSLEAVRVCDEGACSSALHAACMESNHENSKVLVDLLLSHPNVDLGVVDHHQNTQLHTALWAKNLPASKALISDPRAPDQCLSAVDATHHYFPVALACRMGFVEIVETLMEFTSSYRESFRRADNPFQIACSWGQIDVVAALLNHPTTRDILHFYEGDKDPLEQGLKVMMGETLKEDWDRLMSLVLVDRERGFDLTDTVEPQEAPYHFDPSLPSLVTAIRQAWTFLMHYE